MFEENHDAWLEAKLRGVPLPARLQERLRAVAAFSDSELDHELATVVPPGRLRDRLRRIPHDTQIDEALAAVSVPPGLLEALATTPWQTIVETQARQTSARWRRLALAASLLVAAYVAYYGVAAQYLATLRPAVETPASHSLSLASEAAEVTEPLELYVPPNFAPSLAGGAAVAEAGVPAPREEFLPRVASSGQVAENLRQWSDIRPFDDVWLLRWSPLAAPPRAEAAPLIMSRVPVPHPQGVPAPRIRGFDRLFLLKHGVNPVVSPATYPALRGVNAPLVSQTEGFEPVRFALSENRMPAAADVRVEHFLAALNWRWAAPETGPLGLRISGGRTPFCSEGGILLQVAVQAGESPFRSPEGTRLVVAVDVSRSMGFAERLVRVQRGITRLLADLRAGDEFALVAFNDTAATVVDATFTEAAPHEVRTTLERAVSTLQAEGGTDFAGGLRHALGLALEGGAFHGKLRRVVLATDAEPDATQPLLHEVQTTLRKLAGTGITFDVLATHEEQDRQFTELSRLAAAGGGNLAACPSADHVYWALRHLLTTRASLMASGASLRVQFEPSEVVAYRLLGHEPGGGADAWQPASQRVDLRAGEAASVLFEVWLKPGGRNTLGEATLRFSDPAAGTERAVRQRITRLQLAGTWAEAPPALQAAALAAEAAEVLRGSPFANLGGGLRPVLEASGEVHPSVARHREFRELLDWVRKAEQLRMRGRS